MDLKHNLQKLIIYFRPQSPYWRLIEHKNWKAYSKIGPFFGIHLKDRLYDNHYNLFDTQGIPIRGTTSNPIYNYTTICSYALANFEMYLETADSQYIKPLSKVVEFLKKNNERTEYGGIVFPNQDKLSAMNQGEALSVVARAFEMNPDPELKQFASDIALSYFVSVENYGVRGKIKKLNDVYWYEERAVQPAKHILNGMLYALIGLRDILQVFPDMDKVQYLWDKGLDYLEAALPLFDTGRWSWYWVDEQNPNYIASMMYHNLHICQLRHLYNISQRDTFLRYADIFETYQHRWQNRIHAGLALFIGKRILK